MLSNLLAVMGSLAMIVILILCFDAMISDDEQANKDFNYCYGCPCGWCMSVPGDEECQKWRKEHENQNQ